MLAVSVAACGDDSSSDSAGADDTYQVRVVTSQFPAEQHLGQTSLMQIGVQNTSEKTIPALTMTITLGGKEGEGASLPFAIRSPEPGLAQPDRPVWVLSENYPRLAGKSSAAGAETASLNTFDFGPLKPGKTVEAVWKVSAVKTGDFKVDYEIDASLNGDAAAETTGGAKPRGSFSVQISSATPDTTVTDSGEIVTIPPESSQPSR